MLGHGPGMSDGPSTSQPDPALQAEPGPEPAQAVPALASEATVASPPGWRAWGLALNIPLSRVQVFVGLAAGLLSISGFLYPALRASRAPIPLGEVVTVVHEAGSRRPITDATVEILTPGHVLVTTLTPRDEGRARHVIKEGQYRVRVSRPGFAAEMRSIQVLAGTIAEVRFQLTPRPGASAPAPVATTVRRPASSHEAASPRASVMPRPPAPAGGEPPSAAVRESPPAAPLRDVPAVRRSPLREHQSP